ncbi:MAG: mobile mystery protein B [Bdellovibrionales bacterium]|nr:mobile mystery protein B [Bdellovibrionales bacterium]
MSDLETTIPGQTPLTADDIKDLIPYITTRDDLNEVERINITQGMRWLETSKKCKADPISVTTATLIHNKLFSKVWGWAGRFRKHDTNIGIHWSKIPEALKNLLEDVKYWLVNQTYPNDELFARFHHRLVEIHAFPNGNGRHARIYTDYIAKIYGLPPFTWGGSELLDENTSNRKKYISALQQADSKNFAPLVEFMRS